jgi:glutathione S-transferase
MTYIIYGDKGSGAFAAEAALAEIGADYRFEVVSLDRNEQKLASFLTINPSGKMPALRLPNGEIVTESAAILLTLADRHPEAALLPRHGTAGRAQTYRWVVFMAGEIYPMVEIADYPERFASADHAQALRCAARERIRERLHIVEKALAEPWLLPDGFSIADIYAAMFNRWSVGRELRLPKLTRLTERVSQRPRLAEVWRGHFP